MITSRRVIASNVSGPTNRLAERVMIGRDVVALLLQAARDLDRLVGADAAGHAERDEGHAISARITRLKLLMMSLGDRLHAMRPRSLGCDDLLQPDDRRLEIVVDDDVVVVDVAGRLAPRGLEPPLHLLLGVLAAPAQPLLEHLKRGRHHEDRRMVDAARLDLPRTLDVDDQHHILSVGDHVARHHRRSAVIDCRTRPPTPENRTRRCAARTRRD